MEINANSISEKRKDKLTNVTQKLPTLHPVRSAYCRYVGNIVHYKMT